MPDSLTDNQGRSRVDLDVPIVTFFNKSQRQAFLDSQYMVDTVDTRYHVENTFDIFLVHPLYSSAPVMIWNRR